MKHDYPARLKQMRQILREKELDALLVLIAENRRYLSGFTGEDTQFDESAGALFITAEKQILATDSRFDLQSRQDASDYEIILYGKAWPKNCRQFSRDSRSGVWGLKASASPARSTGKFWRH